MLRTAEYVEAADRQLVFAWRGGLPATTKLIIMVNDTKYCKTLCLVGLVI